MKREGSGYCAACGGRIPTGGFPNIVFNFLKTARDPETASPEPEDPRRRGGRVNPASPLPVPATPRLRVGATRPLPGAAGPAPEGGWAGAAAPAESAEIENRRHSRKVGLEVQLGGTSAPASAREPAEPPQFLWRLAVQSRAEGDRQARSFVRRSRARERRGGRAASGCLSLPAEPSSGSPPSPPRGPAAANGSPLRPEAPRLPPGARGKLRVQVGRGGAACPRHGWLDWLPAELGGQTRQDVDLRC